MAYTRPHTADVLNPDQARQCQIGILLFDGVEELDAVGPWEVLSTWTQLHREDGWNAFCLSPDGGPVRSAKTLPLRAHHSIDDAPEWTAGALRTAFLCTPMRRSSATNPVRFEGSYAGPLIKVRRVNTGATRDIYPTSTGPLDTAVIGTFCGAAVCTIATIDDQSGAGQRHDGCDEQE